MSRSPSQPPSQPPKRAVNQEQMQTETETPFESPWTCRSSRHVYDNAWISVREDDVLNPAGRPAIYGVVNFKNRAIGVIPVSESGETWLVGQYRYPLALYSWEIPEGGGRLDRDPQSEAARELKEETGLTALKWTRLFEIHLSNSSTDESAVVFLAQELHEGESEPEDSEDLTVRKLPLSEAFAMVASGQITDAMSVTALLKLELMLLKGEIRFSTISAQS